MVMPKSATEPVGEIVTCPTEISTAGFIELKTMKFRLKFKHFKTTLFSAFCAYQPTKLIPCGKKRPKNPCYFVPEKNEILSRELSKTDNQIFWVFVHSLTKLVKIRQIIRKLIFVKFRKFFDIFDTISLK